jgi:hypothetical protein
MKYSMYRRLIASILVALPFLFLVCILIGSIFIWTHDYEHMIHQAIRFAQRSDLEKMIRSQFFSVEKFKLIRKILIGIITICSFACFYFYKNYNFFRSVIDCNLLSVAMFFSKLKIIALEFNRQHKWFLMLLFGFVLFRSVYYAMVGDIQYDEAWNFNYFLDPSFINSIIAYNNYPLHNLITWLFVKLMGSSVFVMRVPILFVGLLTIYCFMLFTKIYFKQDKLALVVGSIFACLPVTIYYMLRARGVILEVYFTLVVFALLLQFKEKNFTLNRILVLGFLNGLGTYSMLSHVYFIAFSSLGLVFFIKDKWQFAVYYAIASTAFSALFLLPIVLGTGISLGLAAAYDSLPLHFEQLVSTCKTYSFFFTSSSILLPFLLILMLLGTIVYREQNKPLKGILFSLLILSSLVFVPLITGISPPARAMAFIIIPLLFVFSIFISSFILKIPGKPLYVILLLVTISLSYILHTSHLLNWSKRLDANVKKLSVVMQSNAIQTIYNTTESFNYFVPGLEYYYRIRHIPFRYETSLQSSSRYSIKNIKQQACIVIRKSERINLPIGKYYPIFSSEDFVVLKQRFSN